MTDYGQLALTYGGFTSLDKVYLERVLSSLSEEQKLAFITPPPSVINAYFAELYQKKSPEAATSYFFDLSQALDLFQIQPDFSEVKPFVRLNLSGKAYGFCYENSAERAQVFAQQAEEVTPALLFEIAQIFPHYWIFEEEGKIYMEPAPVEEQILDSQSLSALTDVERLASGWQKISGYSQDEVVECAQAYSGRSYFRSQNHLAMIYKQTSS